MNAIKMKIILDKCRVYLVNTKICLIKVPVLFVIYTNFVQSKINF